MRFSFYNSTTQIHTYFECEVERKTRNLFLQKKSKEKGATLKWSKI